MVIFPSFFLRSLREYVSVNPQSKGFQERNGENWCVPDNPPLSPVFPDRTRRITIGIIFYVFIMKPECYWPVFFLFTNYRN